MSYTALYRRYRPNNFSRLVGQEHIARVLSAAARGGGFVHAYLFCGPRGTGKTSAARILARAINCERGGEKGEPCNECASCRRALSGESLDLIEIDSASNRGIDEIRDLRERVKYAPAQDKYKIYIIDEVHMLTKEAFNALLKTLEEPPSHVIFILATTAPHKLPLTVLSRCQRFDFRRIGDDAIRAHLLKIAEAENICLSPEAAELIAKKADGGMRDAVSLLDQCSGASGGKVDAELVSMLLGIVDRSFIKGLMEHLLKKDITAVLTAVEELAASGKDMRQAVCDLGEELRDALLKVIAGPKDAPYPPTAYVELLTALADLDNKLRYAASPRISLELALIKACGIQQPPTPPKAAPPKAAPPKAAPPKAAPPKAEPPKAEPPKAEEQFRAADEDIRISLWEKIEELDRCVYFRIDGCHLLQTGAKKLLLEFPADRQGDHRNIMGSAAHQQTLKKAVEEVLGSGWTIGGRQGDFLSPPDEPEFKPAEAAVPTEAQEEEPQIRQGSLFG